MYTLPDQPMNAFQVFKHSVLFWLNTLMSVLPLTFLYGLLMGGMTYQNAIAPEQITHPGLMALLSLLSVLIAAILLVAIFVRMNSALNATPVSLFDSLKIGLRRFPTVLLWYILIILLFMLPTGILIAISAKLLPHPVNIGAFIFIAVFFLTAVIYIFVSFPLLAIENVSAWNSIKQSYRLVKNQWWHTFSVFLFSLILILIGELIFFKLLALDRVLLTVILMTFGLSFGFGIALIQLRHLRAYHKLKDGQV